MMRGVEIFCVCECAVSVREAMAQHVNRKSNPRPQKNKGPVQLLEGNHVGTERGSWSWSCEVMVMQTTKSEQYDELETVPPPSSDHCVMASSYGPPRKEPTGPRLSSVKLLRDFLCSFNEEL